MVILTPQAMDFEPRKAVVAVAVTVAVAVAAAAAVAVEVTTEVRPPL